MQMSGVETAFCVRDKNAGESMYKQTPFIPYLVYILATGVLLTVNSTDGSKLHSRIEETDTGVAFLRYLSV